MLQAYRADFDVAFDVRVDEFLPLTSFYSSLVT